MSAMAEGTWRSRVAGRATERFRRHPSYGGYLRETPHGFEVVDLQGDVIAGPNPDVAQVVRWAHDLGVEVHAEDLLGGS